ncbi:hypothetical protein F2Q68_00037372 [Brassica cretica]|uniref:Uncharacterized protein n=1 Tax=Brassica cretica TaxID=69181 RepID=A0A8S9H7I9_BRACR|nr:hypothetical protein F2Q68_00037372 [Brassica cretica]
MENIYMYAENWSKRDGKLRTPRGCKNPVNKRPGRLIDRSRLLPDFQAPEDRPSTATTCYVATNPRLMNVSGKYFTDCNETTPSGLGSNSSEATKLWAASEILVTQHSKTGFDPLS